MSAYNAFGADEDAVLRVFATGGYTPAADDFGGSAAIQDAIQDAAHAVAQAMPLPMLRQLTEPDLELIGPRAAEGQSVFPFGTGPVIAGTVHVWAGSPSSFASRPVLATSPWDRGNVGTWRSPSATPAGALVELPEDAFTVDVGAGVVILSVSRVRNDMVYASYRVAVDDPAFAVPSVAGMVVTGAAAVLGGKVFPQATSEWAYVQRLAEEWAGYLGEMAAGRLTPPELRVRRWWAPAEKTQEGGLGSVRRLRG